MYAHTDKQTDFLCVPSFADYVNTPVRVLAAFPYTEMLVPTNYLFVSIHTHRFLPCQKDTFSEYSVINIQSVHAHTHTHIRLLSDNR